MSLTRMQEEFLQNCNHRWNIKYGATGSGKSWLDYCVTIPKRCFAMRGEGLAVMLGNTKGTLERNILDPMRNLWGEELVGYIGSDNTVRIFGKKFYALGADNKKRVEKIQGSTIEYCYGDEVTTWSQEVFEMLKSRLRTPNSCFDGTCNPDNPNHWFKTFIESDADVYAQKYTIDDGCLPAQVVKELKKEYAGTFRYKRYIDGDWAMAEGVVYDMFSDSINIATTEEIEPKLIKGDRFVSVDYGTQNACVFLLWEHGLDGVWYNTREYYYSGRDRGTQKTDSEYADDMAEWLNGDKVRAVIIDPSASSFIAELRKRGYSVLKAKNDVKNGIRLVSTMLQKGLLVFTTNSRHTLNEFNAYAWDEKAGENGEDKPLKFNDHCMDALRYFVMTYMYGLASIKEKRKVGL